MRNEYNIAHNIAHNTHVTCRNTFIKTIYFMTTCLISMDIIHSDVFEFTYTEKKYINIDNKTFLKIYKFTSSLSVYFNFCKHCNFVGLK